MVGLLPLQTSRRAVLLFLLVELRLFSVFVNPMGGFRVPAVRELKPLVQTCYQSWLNLSALSCRSVLLHGENNIFSHYKYYRYCWVSRHPDICFAVCVLSMEISSALFSNNSSSLVYTVLHIHTGNNTSRVKECIVSYYFIGFIGPDVFIHCTDY